MDEAEKFRKRGKVLSESPSKGLSFDAGPLKEGGSELSGIPKGPSGTLWAKPCTGSSDGQNRLF